MAGGYEPLVSETTHAPLAVVLLSLGFAVAGWFYVYEFRTKEKTLAVELATGVSGATFIGLGSFFLMLSCGLYV